MMRTDSATNNGDIHRQQLFYWMGSDLDVKNRNRKTLSDDLVQECLKRLRCSLESGLWVKSPRIPERLELRGKSFHLSTPIACFTEWSLGDSLSHTSQYGRIGLGFPKRWVIEQGGQSVTYFRHKESGNFLRSVFRLLDALGQYDGNGNWTPRDGMPCFEHLRYLLHFAKMIRPKKKLSEPPREPRRVSGRKKPSKATVDAQTFKRKFGLSLPYVEEREWRIVYHPGNKNFKKGSRVPEYYLPYLPGEELFTLVLPDNKVVSKVLQDEWFTERLFTPWKHCTALKGRHVPPVMLLSHSDIGTF